MHNLDLSRHDLKPSNKKCMNRRGLPASLEGCVPQDRERHTPTMFFEFFFENVKTFS